MCWSQPLVDGRLLVCQVSTCHKPRSSHGQDPLPIHALAVVALDRLEVLVRNRLKRLQYRPDTLDGFIVGTGLTFDDPASP